MTDRLPISGASVRGSRTGRPIMALLDLIGQRWTLRILWELRHGPLTARLLRSRCDDASPSVLHARLSDLRKAGFVTLEPKGGYRLTGTGEAFTNAFLPLNRFAESWAAREAEPDA